MPANLTPDYLEAEANSSRPKRPTRKIRALEIMMALIPQAQGTEKIRAQLKSRNGQIEGRLQRKPTVGKAEQAFYIKKEGTAQILLVGLPNTGKSTSFLKMHHAVSEVAD